MEPTKEKFSEPIDHINSESFYKNDLNIIVYLVARGTFRTWVLCVLLAFIAHFVPLTGMVAKMIFLVAWNVLVTLFPP